MNTSSHTPNSIPRTNLLVESFVADCRSRHLSDRTCGWYSGILRAFAARFPELPTDRHVITEYIGSLDGIGDERRHGVFRTLRAFYNWLEESELQSFGFHSPIIKRMAPRRLPKDKAALTLLQLKGFLEGPLCSDHEQNLRAILYLLADTGLRLEEAHSVDTRTDIVSEGVHFRKGKTRTGIVPVHSDVRKMLEGLPPGPVWPHSKGNLGRVISEAFTAAGLPEFTAHSLRHTFVSLFKGDSLDIGAITGHSLPMVEHYSHRRLERAIASHRTGSPIAQFHGADLAGQGEESQANRASGPAGVCDSRVYDLELASYVKAFPGLPGSLVIAAGKSLAAGCIASMIDELSQQARKSLVPSLTGVLYRWLTEQVIPPDCPDVEVAELMNGIYDVMDADLKACLATKRREAKAYADLLGSHEFDELKVRTAIVAGIAAAMPGFYGVPSEVALDVDSLSELAEVLTALLGELSSCGWRPPIRLAALFANGGTFVADLVDHGAGSMGLEERAAVEGLAETDNMPANFMITDASGTAARALMFRNGDRLEYRIEQ